MALPFRDVMTSPFSFSFLVMSTLSCCRFDSWNVLNPFEVFEYSMNLFQSLRSFFVPDAFQNCVVTSFNRCYSSLGVVLLSSISLMISASSFEISSLDSSVFFCCCCFTCFFLLEFHHDLILVANGSTQSVVLFFLIHVVAGM